MFPLVLAWFGLVWAGIYNPSSPVTPAARPYCCCVPQPCDAQCVAICNSSPSLAVAYGFRCFATYSDNGGGGGGGGFGGGGSSGGGGGPSGGSGGSANKAAAHDG